MNDEIHRELAGAAIGKMSPWELEWLASTDPPVWMARMIRERELALGREFAAAREQVRYERTLLRKVG